MFKKLKLYGALFFIFTTVVVTSVRSAYSQENTLLTQPSAKWFNYGVVQSLTDSDLNPDNSLFLVPDRTLVSDLRPSLRIKTGDGNFTLFARGRFMTELSSFEASDKRKYERPRSSSRILDSYVEWNAGEKVLFSFGVQNYQWGAAESFNPSNRVFHSSSGLKDQLTESDSKHIARVNLTWMKNFSTVFLTENEELKDSEVFQSDIDFQTVSLLKNELSWNDGADYIGLVVGAGEARGQWFGEYFNLTLVDGLTLYADASHQKGATPWYPFERESTDVPGQTVVDYRFRDSAKAAEVETFAVAGVRYSFEGGSDIRLEGIRNSAGWDSDELDLAVKGFDRTQQAQLPLIAQNQAKWLKPGLEVRGKDYVYFSLRTVDLFSFKDLTMTVRAMHSGNDQSGTVFVGFDYAISETPVTLLASYRGNYGDRNSELKSLIESRGLVGVQADF